MLPCARSCTGKKLKHLPAVCAESQSWDPLLFLYPKWFQEVARDAKHTRLIGARKFTTTRRIWSSTSIALRKENDQQFIDNNTRSRQCLDTNGGPSYTTVPRNVYLDDRTSPTVRKSRVHEAARPYDRSVASRSRERKNQVLEESLLQRQRQKQRTAPYHSQRLNGLELARKLSSIPPNTPVDSTTIQLEAEFLQWFTGTLEENIWKHHDGSGCVIHMQPNVSHDGEHRKVVLTGTQRAKDITIQHLKSLQDQYHHGSTDCAAIEAADSQSAIPGDYIRVDQVPRPAAWNLKTFLQYVTLVTNARAPRAVERILYPGKDSFKVAAAGILMDIFSDPQLYRYQSSVALRQALKFFSGKTDIANYARYVWSASRQAGIIPDIACFNLEIGRFVAVRNELSIQRLIREMEATRTQPNGTTWGYFYKLLNSAKERNMFLRLPHNQYMFHEDLAKESMIESFVKTSFEPSDQVPNCVSMFQRKIAGSFGEDWLTSLVMQRMIEKSAEVGAFQTLSKVVKLATDVNLQLDPDSFTVLFKAVVKSGWFEDVLSLLQLMPVHFDFHYRQVLIERAFREAWRQRLTNTARVLWHYAASHGSIRHTMLMKVAKQLTNNAHVPGERIVSTMAAVIVGTDQSPFTTEIPQDSRETRDAVLNLIVSLKQWTPEGKARHDQMQQAHLLLERELTAWQRVEPMPHSALMEQLRKAFNEDLSWHRSKIMSKAPLLEIMKQAIEIELTPRKVQIDIPELQLARVDETDSLLTRSSGRDQSNINSVSTPPNRIDELKLSQADRGQDRYQEETQLYATNFSNFTRFSSSCHSALPTTGIIPASIGIPFIDLVLQYLGLVHDEG